MRDPVMYRVMPKTQHRTGNDWKIFPMYDWTHGESDYIEQISHSFCTLEFLPHRELYDWFLDQVHDPSKKTKTAGICQKKFKPYHCQQKTIGRKIGRAHV